MSGITYREDFQQTFGSPARNWYSYQCRLTCGADSPFFAKATSDAAHPNGREPFDYQRRLAEDSACQSRLIETPFRFGNR
jgi:hypothetical protein